MNKKSQVSGYVFIYILTAVLVSVIFIYGYNAITNFRQQAEQLALLKFENELQNSVDKVSFSKNTVEIKDFSVPGQFSEVCIIKNNPNLPDLTGTSIEADYPIIFDSVKDDLEKNIFLLSSKLPHSFWIEHKIQTAILTSPSAPPTETNFLCLEPLTGKLRLRLENKGTYVQITEFTT
tara:strand:- start:31767 stop:32300 length:534 start_codon:yes stop_codon:yes gene_type:complete